MNPRTSTRVVSIGNIVNKSVPVRGKEDNYKFYKSKRLDYRLHVNFLKIYAHWPRIYGGGIRGNREMLHFDFEMCEIFGSI